MRSGTTLSRSGILIICLLFSSLWSSAQSYSFRNYGAEYGIPNGFVYTVSQANDGFLWVGTGDGIARFDGYEYYRVPYPDSVETRNPNTCLKDSNGNIWFGCNDGSVFRTNGHKLEKIAIKNTRSISQIVQGPDKLIYVFPQGNSVFAINPDNNSIAGQFGFPSEYVIISAAFGVDDQLLLGTQGSVLFCSTGTDTIKINDIVENFEYAGITAISRINKSDYLIGTDFEGLFLVKKGESGYSVTPVGVAPGQDKLKVRSLLVDEANKIWVSTDDAGVIQFSLREDGTIFPGHTYNVSSGLTSNDVRTVFSDLEGNLWFGLFGDGLSMIVSSAFSRYEPGKNSRENDIIYVARYGENYLLGTPDGFHLFDINSGRQVSYKNLISTVGGDQILSYFLDDRNNLWIGTGGYGLYVWEPAGKIRRFYRSGDSGTDWINDIEVDGNNIWLASTNGVTVIDRNSGTLKKNVTTNDGLPGKSISRIRIDHDKAYIGTESDRLYVIDKDFKIVSQNCIMSGSTINKIVGFTSVTDGIVWVATSGNGVFACRGDSVTNISRSNGLYSNYCYSILADKEGNIWIGHARGISEIEKSTGIIKTFGADYIKNGVCNPGGMYESPDGKILAGTTEGMIVYDSSKDQKNEVPPFNNITSIVINDSVYSYQPVIELPYKKYRVTIKFTGVNFSAPDKVYYQPFLSNFDFEPGRLSASREVTYNLGDGEYKFSLLSIDENGIANENGASFIIDIAKPFYKTWWFIVLAVTVILLTVIMIIREREKVQKKQREYLEDELSKRTSLIMKQKSEIEIQNLEITDSINYAKRIQSNILPDIGKLRDSFHECFIVFHPRDIVSGDFYWFDKVDEDRFIIVCADSTGHGVPGAFMSMIGSTLLQDIVTRKRITRPSQILGMLDKQIFSTLNQNVDLGVSNDGMDMVICEFNLKTKHIRFASAMRPIILVMAGESYYIKGNRSSVGGESVIEKYFDDQEYFLNEGDAIYFFSDGLPDQFGGIDGKKMKIARLKRLIDQISGLPMREQEATITRFFDEWKGGYDQVDDILMMGVKV